MQSIINRFVYAVAATAIVSAAMLFIGTQNTYAATQTWNGEGDATTFADGDNWVSDSAPADGDDIVFDTDAVDFSLAGTLDNDLTANNAINSITINGTEDSSYPRIEFDGNAIDLTGSITSNNSEANLIILTDVTVTGNHAVDGNVSYGFSGDTDATVDFGSNNVTITAQLGIYSALTGSGTIDVNSGSYFTVGTNTHSGVLTFAAGTAGRFGGTLTTEGASSGKTVIESGAVMGVTPVDGSNWSTNEPFHISGDGVDGYTERAFTVGAVSTGPGAGGGAVGDPEYGNLVFNGKITLGSDINVWAWATYKDSKFKLNDVALAGNEITVESGSSGTFVIEGDTLADPEPIEETITNDKPDETVNIYNDQTYTINGERGTVVVNDGGTLKGTGTVGNLYVTNGGVLAPGESPGCLSSGDLNLSSGSTYDFEIDGNTVCDEYDQTQVAGTVDVTDSTLNVVFGADFEPEIDDEFIIIRNNLGDAVTGEFDGLADGSTFDVGEVTFRINYDGGTGNDIVLTVTANPNAPSTGLGDLAGSSTATLAATTVIATLAMLGASKLVRKQ